MIKLVLKTAKTAIEQVNLYSLGFRLPVIGEEHNKLTPEEIISTQPMITQIPRNYTAYSGVDIRAIVEGTKTAELEPISYNVQKDPPGGVVYLIGEVKRKPFDRPKQWKFLSIMLGAE